VEGGVRHSAECGIEGELEQDENRRKIKSPSCFWFLT